MEYTCKTCQKNFKRKLTLKEKTERFKPTFCCQDCAVAWSIVSQKKFQKAARKNNRIPQSSKEEVNFGNLIRSYFPQLETQYKIKGYEHHYDFYSPELGLLIEYNGVYWHNMPKNKIKDLKHLNEATKNGVHMAVITDTDWKVFLDSGLPDKIKLVKFLSHHTKNMKK